VSRLGGAEVRRVFFSAAVLLFASALLASPGGVTREQFLEQNGIDPAEPAFVRIVRSELPGNCDGKAVADFVAESTPLWLSVQQGDLERGSTDGHTVVRLAIANGQPTESTVAWDSIGSPSLMERLEADFSRIRFARTCVGAAEIELRFHLPSEPARASL